jgi:hypothetical protein
MEHLRDIHHVPEFTRLEIEHFFNVYKELEPGKSVEGSNWVGRSDAEGEIVGPTSVPVRQETTMTAPALDRLDDHFGEALVTDYFLLREDFSLEQAAYRQRARTCVHGSPAGYRRLLGACRVPVAADREARCDRPRRRCRDRPVRLPSDGRLVALRLLRVLF